MGIIQQAKNIHRPLPEKQPQQDIIQCLRNILTTIPNAISYHHVYGHQDDTTPISELPVMAQLNIIADKVAKEALEQGVASNSYITTPWPFKGIAIQVTGTKVTASLKDSMYRSWGHKVAKKLYANCLHYGEEEG